MEEIQIKIISPKEGETFLSKTFPVETEQIFLQCKLLQNKIDITSKVLINWNLKLGWRGTYDTYQTMIKLSGNSVSTKFQTGGTLRIRASTTIKKKEYIDFVRVTIIGTNPFSEQLNKALDTGILKAIAWEESKWKQFDNNGQPLKNSKSSMSGLLQISEWWWGKKSPLPLKDFNRISWQWDYNIQVAKLILEYYYNQVLKKFPKENKEKQLDRTIKAYKVGPSSFETKMDPVKYWYVKNIRKHIITKPWEK